MWRQVIEREIGRADGQIEEQTIAASAHAPDTSNKMSRERVIGQLDIWRKQLINLARSNRLLNFRHTRTSTLEIVGDPETLAGVVSRLLAGGSWGFHMPPDEPTEVGSITGVDGAAAGMHELMTSKRTGPELRAALRSLDRRATQEFMDKGLWILHLAVGMLRWTDPDSGEEAESPLVLVPVQLRRASPREPYELGRADEDVVLNPALVVKLAEFGVELPMVDEDAFEMSTALLAFERAVAGQSGWVVERRLVVSPFSFHKEVMYRDLVRNEAVVSDHPLVQALAVGAKEDFGLDFDVIPENRLDDDASPEDVATILDADATQRQCINAAVTGHSFVMDGPPGTGKSQTIANMIAELLANGKTVLFVSEKAAALEVVHKRLWAAGLADYCLEIHSHKAQRKEVVKQLAAALELHPANLRPMTDAATAQLVRRRKELSVRAAAMNESREPLGRTLYDVIGRIAQLQHLQQAPPPPELRRSLTSDALTRILITAGEISRAWGPVTQGADFVWRDLRNTVIDAGRSHQTNTEVATAVTALSALELVVGDVADSLVLQAPHDFGSSEALARVIAHLETRPAALPLEWLTCEDLDGIEALRQARRELATTHARAVTTLLNVLGATWRRVSEEIAEQTTAALARLRPLELTFEPAETLPEAELRGLSKFLTDNRSVISAVRADAEIVAGGFGLPLTGMTLSRASELAELGSLAVEPERPESAWIDVSILARVERAARTLHPLCSALNEQQALLSPFFNEEVLTLDLEGLCHRFQEVHTGLGKLRGAYRADKKTVASAAKAGRAIREVVQLLPQALAWQRVARDLETAERREADCLGSTYYRSTATDFDALTRAIANARRAIHIVGERTNLDATRRQLGRDAIPDAKIVGAASNLRTSTERWARDASVHLGPVAGTLAHADLDALRLWCDRACGPIEILADTASIVIDLAGRPVSFTELEACLEARSMVAKVESTLAATRSDDQRELGESYQGVDTNWDALASAIAWTAQLRELLGHVLTHAAARRLASVELDWRVIEAALNEWHRSRDVVLANFLSARAGELRSDLDTTFSDAEDLLHHFSATVGDVDEWVEFQTARENLRQLGVGGVIDFCESTRVGSEQVSEIVERACLERWADLVIEGDRGRLRQLRADQLDPVLNEFRELDRELVRRMAGKVIAACNLRRPRTTVGAAGIIMREAEKQRRHMPVRTLLEQTGDVAQLLKPCFMMSPLTVSQFLPPSLHFDAVIFDEASQVRPCDAINCIYRGSQLIIAGDDKQLPPTSFFEAVSVDGDDQWEEDQFEDFESIIKLAKGSGGLRELPLKWHYRSQHEDLIAYSNFSFYDGRLITFPSAAAQADDLGVKLIHVPNGVYRRGTSRDNPIEAGVVVDRVIHWAKHSLDHPTRSVTVGVVAFSEAQAEAIEVALERRREELPELDAFFDEDRLDGFFVKNLENVQGDERDVMIFSVGYGRDENGKLTMNFGPLNREGGERRLNVAITRARRRVELVASITGTEAEFATILSEGPRHLQRYLDYAHRGAVALAIDIGGEGHDAESPFEEEVLRTIHAWGYKTMPQVGTAGYRVDIGVWHPSMSGQFALGIECDGRMYHSSKVARDRDRLRQEVLEGLGWKIYRIWGTSWYRYRAEQETRLKVAIEGAINDVPTSPRQSTPETRNKRKVSDERFEVVALDEAPAWTVPYRVATPAQPRYWMDMHLPEAQPELRRLITKVVRVEGPIEDELLLRRVREVWGLGRAGHRIREAFRFALASLTQGGDMQRLDESYSFSGQEQLGVVRVPGTDPLALRTVTQVSRLERASAIQHLVADARRVSRDELTFEVCRLFGWNRRGPGIAAALDEAVDALVREGMIADNDGFLKAA